MKEFVFNQFVRWFGLQRGVWLFLFCFSWWFGHRGPGFSGYRCIVSFAEYVLGYLFLVFRCVCWYALVVNVYHIVRALLGW